MDRVVWIGFLAFFLVSLTVGVRLLLLWRRTRQLPELLIGIGVLGIGPVGFGSSMFGSLLAPSHPHSGVLLLGLGSLAVATGVVAKCVFNWRVYRPDAAWPRTVTFASAALLGVAFGVDLGRGFTSALAPGPLYYVRTTIQVGALLWGAGEALRWWRLMRRRLALGLADPVVTNRFLMWGIGAGAAGVGSLVGVVAQVATGVSMREIGWVTASSSAHGMVAAIAIWLAFVPPAAYRRWIAGEAAPATGAAR
jgi:hypothetical protein